jgi:hypothetical protein
MHSPESLRQLVDEFAAAVEKQTEAIESHEPEWGPEFAQRYVASFRELRTAGKPGLDALADLLTDSRRDVRTMAACFLLRHRTNEALTILKSSAAEKGFIGLGASMTLRRWEDGSWNLGDL